MKSTKNVVWGPKCSSQTMALAPSYRSSWLLTSKLVRGNNTLLASRDHRHTRRSEEHTSELQSRGHLVCRLLLEKKKQEDHTSHLEDKTDDVYESEVQQAIKRFLDKHVTTEKEEIIK